MRSILAMSVGFVLGTLSGNQVPSGWEWLGPILALGLGTWLSVMARELRGHPGWLLHGGFALVAAAAGSGVRIPLDGDAPKGRVEIVGYVERVRFSGDDVSSLVRVESATPLERSIAPLTSALLQFRHLHYLEGTRLTGIVALSARVPYRNTSPHPPWPVADPVLADARPVALRERGRNELRYRIGLLREHVRSALIRTLDDPACAVARCLLLGDSALESEYVDVVRQSGVAHVLAVSGMHVTLMIGFFVALLSRALAMIPWFARRYPAERVALVVGIPSVLALAAFAGGAPSAWRAAITTAIVWGLRLMGRRAEPLSVVGCAVLVFALADPPGVLRPGFLLSILATAAILGAEGEPASFTTLVLATLRATIATAPIALWCFGGLPLIGILTNIVLVPVASALLLPLAMLHGAFASLGLPGEELTRSAFEMSARAFLAGCAAFAEFSYGREVLPPDLVEEVLVALTCGGVLIAGFRARALSIVVVALLALGAAELRLRNMESPRDGLRISYLDVAQGDSALIDLPDGRLLLIDSGGKVGGARDPGEAVLVPLLRARRRRRIDIAIITHPHPDHYGGLGALLESVEIGELWDTGQARAEPGFDEWTAILDRAERLGVPVRNPSAVCGRHAWGSLTLRVLWPCPGFDSGFDANDNSFVLELEFGEHRFLFSGDIEALAEEALSRSGQLRPIDVLKVPHHGSRTSSTVPLLNALRPRISIISAGPSNHFGHPHPDVLARLMTRSVVLRTDLEGSVTVHSDGSRLVAQTWSGRTLDTDALPRLRAWEWSKP